LFCRSGSLLNQLTSPRMKQLVARALLVIAEIPPAQRDNALVKILLEFFVAQLGAKYPSKAVPVPGSTTTASDAATPGALMAPPERPQTAASDAAGQSTPHLPSPIFVTADRHDEIHEVTSNP